MLQQSTKFRLLRCVDLATENGLQAGVQCVNPTSKEFHHILPRQFPFWPRTPPAIVRVPPRDSSRRQQFQNAAIAFRLRAPDRSSATPRLNERYECPVETCVCENPQPTLRHRQYAGSRLSSPQSAIRDPQS